MSYNPSVFDDKMSVLSQLETLKGVVKEHEQEVVDLVNQTKQEISFDVDEAKAEIYALSEDLASTKAQLAYAQDDISDVESDVSELQQSDARSLKIPVSTLPETKLVGVTSGKAQTMITVGDGLSLDENFVLDIKASEEEEYEVVETGTYLHILSVYCYDEYYMPNAGTGVISVASTEKDPIKFYADDGNMTARQKLAAMLYETPEKTFYFFTSAGEKCSIGADSSDSLVFNNKDTSETISDGRVGVSDTVFPQYKRQAVIPTPDFSKTFDLEVNLASWYISDNQVNTDGVGTQGDYEPIYVKAFGGDQEVSVFPGDSFVTLQVPTNTRLIEFWTLTSGGEAKAWPGAGLPGYRCDIDGGYEPIIYKIPKDTTSITFYTESGYATNLENIWPLAD